MFESNRRERATPPRRFRRFESWSFFGVVHREIKLAEGCAFLQGIVTGAECRNTDGLSAVRADGNRGDISGKRAYSAETGDDRGVSAIAKGLERRILPQKKQMAEVKLHFSKSSERKKVNRGAIKEKFRVFGPVVMVGRIDIDAVAVDFPGIRFAQRFGCEGAFNPVAIFE